MGEPGREGAFEGGGGAKEVRGGRGVVGHEEGKKSEVWRNEKWVGTPPTVFVAPQLSAVT
jgi:hypothetical protein